MTKDYPCRIVRVVDGDTVDVLVSVGLGSWVERRVRLEGVDSPESRTRDPREKRFGLMAKARVVALLPGWSLQRVRLREHGLGKYNRTLGDFLLRDDPGDTLCGRLVQERLAITYEGRSKSAIRSAHEANWDYLDGLGE